MASPISRNSGIASSVKLFIPWYIVSASPWILEAGMNTSMNATETAPSANATGIPENSRISVPATNSRPISCGPIARPLVAAQRDFLDDLHDVFERDQREARADQCERDPQRRCPHRFGAPAFTPRDRHVLPDLHGEECA